MTIEKEIIKELAIKYGVTMEKIENLITLQHKFVGHIMSKEADREKDYFPSIRVLGLGIFYCPKYLPSKIKKKE